MVLTFSTDQFKAFAKPARDAWIATSARRLYQFYPEYFAALHVEAGDLEPLCQAVEDWAGTYDITGARDISQLCCVASTFGHRFWQDPRFNRYLNTSIGDAKVARSDAVARLVANAHDWLTVLWDNDEMQSFASRMEYYMRRDAEPTPQILMAILPGHWRLFENEFNEKLIAWLIGRLPETRLPAQRLGYVACALVHGTGWRHDPQYGLICRAVEAAQTPSNLAAALFEIYEGVS